MKREITWNAARTIAAVLGGSLALMLAAPLGAQVVAPESAATANDDSGIQFLDERTPAPEQATADERAKEQKSAGEADVFLRVLRDEQKQPIALETSVVRYRPASGSGEITVDLIGAIHIGDALYYEKLNKLFDEYDVVLYELVAQPGERPTKDRPSDNPLAMLQGLMTSGLGLDSQLAKIDYSKDHFVHADLSPEQLAEAMRKRGDNGFTVALGVIADMMRAQNLRELAAEQEANEEPATEALEQTPDDAVEDPFADLFSMILDPDAPRKMKRTMAEQFADAEQVASGLGPTLNTLIIEDRNQAALKVLQKQMAAGKKKIAIFYGAAHMSDFEKRLKEDFDLARQDVTWITAWDLTKRGEGLRLPGELNLPELFRELAPAFDD